MNDKIGSRKSKVEIFDLKCVGLKDNGMRSDAPAVGEYRTHLCAPFGGRETV